MLLSCFVTSQRDRNDFICDFRDVNNEIKPLSKLSNFSFQKRLFYSKVSQDTFFESINMFSDKIIAAMRASQEDKIFTKPHFRKFAECQHDSMTSLNASGFLPKFLQSNSSSIYEIFLSLNNFFSLLYKKNEKSTFEA